MPSAVHSNSGHVMAAFATPDNFYFPSFTASQETARSHQPIPSAPQQAMPAAFAHPSALADTFASMDDASGGPSSDEIETLFDEILRSDSMDSGTSSGARSSPPPVSATQSTSVSASASFADLSGIAGGMVQDGGMAAAAASAVAMDYLMEQDAFAKAAYAVQAHRMMMPHVVPQMQGNYIARPHGYRNNSAASIVPVASRRSSLASASGQALSLMSSGHVGKSKPHACEVCHKAFLRRHDLKRHFITHAASKGHACDVCGEKFSRVDALKRHHRNARCRGFMRFDPMAFSSEPAQ